MSALAAALAELRTAQADVAHMDQRTWTGALANKISSGARAAAYGRERQAWAALDALAASSQPIAWESALQPFFRSFITHERYQQLGPKFKPWYRPYRCASCARVAAATSPECGDSIETSEREAVELSRTPLDPNAPIDDAAERRLQYHGVGAARAAGGATS